MKLNKQVASILLVVGLLIGGLVAGIVIVGQPAGASAAPSSQTSDPCVEDDDAMEAEETEDLDDVQEEVECGPQDENEADEANGPDEVNEAGETDESDEVAPSDLALSSAQAQEIAEDANPGASTLAVEFDRENGVDIWEVELDNGLDVKVNAKNGEILLSETRD